MASYSLWLCIIVYVALISHFTFAYSIHRAFASATLRTKSMSQTILHMSTDTSTTYPELDLGEFENVKFQQVDGTNTFGKYRLEATVKASEFEGFRPGKLPPYVMPDVRKYLVCYGLEAVIGQLCNQNSLELKSEKGDPVPFGEDVYYNTIIQKDENGLDYYQQRDAWKEGRDLKFAAEFYAEKVENGEEASSQESENKVIDTEISPAQ